jgi:hypothetical protein
MQDKQAQRLAAPATSAALTAATPGQRKIAMDKTRSAAEGYAGQPRKRRDYEPLLASFAGTLSKGTILS